VRHHDGYAELSVLGAMGPAALVAPPRWLLRNARMTWVKIWTRSCCR